MPQPPDTYDSPWKEALEVYLRPILEFCFPAVGAAIDWDAGFEFLDKELQEITREAALGEQRVDKLIQVRLRDGSEKRILIHVEVQHQHDVDLPFRIYRYHYRVRDRFGKRVATLVILADERADWRPDHFEEEALGCRVRLDFPICKLLDLVETAEAASRTGQPPAVLILANWATQRTRHDPPERKRWKWDLTRRLYEAGLDRKDILELYRLLDWLMRLPEGLEREYKQQLKEYEQSKIMPYVTSIERMGREEGRVEGRAEGRMEGRAEGRAEGLVEALRDNVIEALEVRFGQVPLAARQRVNQSNDASQLKAWLRLAVRCADVAEFERALQP